MTNPLDEQQAAHVRCLQDFAAAYDAESANGRALRAAIDALTAPPLCAKGEALAPTPMIDYGDFRGSVPAYRLGAYYYNFRPTGIDAIDLILSAVACAGKAFHHTESWQDECEPYHDRLRGGSPQDWIQNAAYDAAEALRTTPAQPRREVTDADVDRACEVAALSTCEDVWPGERREAEIAACRNFMRAALESFANGESAP